MYKRLQCIAIRHPISTVPTIPPSCSISTATATSLRFNLCNDLPPPNRVKSRFCRFMMEGVSETEEFAEKGGCPGSEEAGGGCVD